MAETSDFLPFFRSRFGSVVIVARAKFAWCHRHNNKPERSEEIKISREKQPASYYVAASKLATK